MLMNYARRSIVGRLLGVKRPDAPPLHR
jgi:hypothetical protein